MNKNIYLLALALFANMAQAEDELDGFSSYEKQILQGDPFLNSYQDVNSSKFEIGKTLSNVEKEKIVLSDSGYQFNESDYVKAIETGDVIAVRRFINAGMDPSSLKTYGNSTLFYSIRGNKPEMFDMLIKLGADVNYVNKRSQNLLLQTIEAGYNKMIPKLIENNIDVKFIDHNAWSAMHYAIESKNIPVVLTLLTKAPDLLKFKNRFSNTPLLLALDKAYKNKDTELLVLAKMLLVKDQFINVSNAVGNTPLHFAVMMRHYDLTKMILEKGANPNLKNAKDWRPIDVAIKNDSIDIANLLRYYGARL